MASEFESHNIIGRKRHRTLYAFLELPKRLQGFFKVLFLQCG
jgi:hypothetical protein